MVLKISDIFFVLGNISGAKKVRKKIHNPKVLESFSGKTDFIPLRCLCEDSGFKNSNFGKS